MIYMVHVGITVLKSLELYVVAMCASVIHDMISNMLITLSMGKMIHVFCHSAS